MKTATLKQQWLVTVKSLHAPAEWAPGKWRELLTAYQEPQRRYHTLKHIGQMLAFTHKHRKLAHDYLAIRFAIWMHDFVYDPKAKDNEERSAETAIAWLREIKAPDRFIARVNRLILATKIHRATNRDSDAKLLLDADLAILASSQKDYAAYARAIRKEYAWVPLPDYQVGRTKVLDNFLKRKRLYFTAAMFPREKQARRNLVREIASLRA